MKKLVILALLLVASQAMAQVMSLDTVARTALPNEGRETWNTNTATISKALKPQNTFYVSAAFTGIGNPYFTSLSTALDSVTPGTSTIVDISPGTYSVGSTMLIPSNVTIEGNGAVLRLTSLPVTEGVLKNYNTATGDSNITIRNLIVDVDSITSAQTGATNAFVFYRSKNIRIENCEVYDNRNYGFYFLGSHKIKLVGCRTRNTDSPFEFRQKSYDIELVNCSSEAGPYQTMGLLIWENCHDVSIVNLQVSGQGNATANVGIQILDSWGINIANSNVNITGGASNAGLYLGVDAIGSTGVVVPPPVAHNVEDIQIVNSTFTVDKTGLYTLGKQNYSYRNIRLSNVTFLKPSSGDVATRLFNMQGLNDGLLLDKVMFRDSTVSTSPELFYLRFAENTRISESTFWSKAATGHKVLLVEPWKSRVSGCTFGDSVVFKTEFLNDPDTRHSFNGYNVYRENIFGARKEPNMHVRWEQYSDIIGNKFTYLDSANLATTRPLIIGTGSQHLNVDKNFFANPTIVDSSFYSSFGGNDFGVGTRKAAYGTLESVTQIRAGGDFNDYGVYKANMIAKDTTRIDTTEGSQRTIAEFQGRASGSPDPNDVSFLVSATRTATANTGWLSSAMRLAYVVGDAFRTYATNKSFMDFGNAEIRQGTDGNVRDIMNAYGNRIIYDPLYATKGAAIESLYVSNGIGGSIYIKRSGNSLVFADVESGTEYTLSQLAGAAPVGDSTAFIYKVTGGAFTGDTLEISPQGYISINRSGHVVTFYPDTSAGKLMTQTMGALKAPIASPSFTGTVTLPTGLTGTLRATAGVVSATPSDTAGQAANRFWWEYTARQRDSLKFAAGTGIELSQSAGQLTITSTVTGGGGGSPVGFYMDDSASGVGSYHLMLGYPIARTEEIDSATVDGDAPAIDTVLIDGYVSLPLGGTSIEGGRWDVSLFRGVSAGAGDSRIIVQFYKISTGLTETLLFTLTSSEIENSTIAVEEITSVQPAYAIDPTDRLLVKFYATTTSTSPKIVYMSHNGTSRYTHIHSSLVTRHNDLAGIQGGTTADYQHLTTAQVALVTGALQKTAVGDSVDANTVPIQTSSGYEPRDSSGVMVNGKYYVPQILLASITLDSSCQFTSDTTQIGYVQYKSVIDTIILYSNSTVSLTPRFLIGSTPAVTSPAAFTTARAATRISTFNASSVAARSMLSLVFDAITTKATKLSVYIYGHPVP